MAQILKTLRRLDKKSVETSEPVMLLPIEGMGAKLGEGTHLTLSQDI